jgi:hypothetical protein
MAESDEHRFIASTFIDLVSELSNSELYGYLEADRGGFDFACMLERDRSRPLVGQTLRHHASGIEKDLNWLIFDQKAEIPVYLYSDSARNVTRIRDTLHRMQPSMSSRTAVMRLYSYPADFDADDENQRNTVRELLREKVTDDLLMNILFGKLTAPDVAMFLSVTNISGLLLACLEEFAVNGMMNYTDLAKRLDAKSATVRARVQMLWASGMLHQKDGALLFRLTQRARVFLKVCNLLARDAVITPELAYILGRLGLSSATEVSSADRTPRVHFTFDDSIPEAHFTFEDAQPETRLRRQLLNEIDAAEARWGVSVSGGPYSEHSLPAPIPSSVRDQPWVGR